MMGLVGAVMLFIGMKHPREVAGTWLGFFAGTFLWTGWIEFAFVWNAAWLGVPDGIVVVTPKGTKQPFEQAQRAG